MQNPKQIEGPWEPWWTNRAPCSFGITEVKSLDPAKLGTNLNLFKDDPAEEAKTEEKEENEFEDDSEESAEENLYHDDLRR